MQYLCIQNKNEVEALGFSLMGASVKGDDAIGMFGSGTKYSLATLLRNGIVPRIFSGTNEIVIGERATKFRDQNFDVITINGQDTGITTSTGLKWRVDQCIREFYSNALDEGEAKAFMTHTIEPLGGTTRVFLPAEPGSTAERMWEEWGKYFLDRSHSPIATSTDGEDSVYYISATGNVPSIMRRGVWCVEHWNDFEPIFSYNIKQIDLPETRLVVAGVCRGRAAGALHQMTDTNAIDMLLAQADNPRSFEWYSLHNGWGTPARAFVAYISSKYDWIATERDINHFPNSMRPRVLLCSYSAFQYLKQLGFRDIRNYRNSDILYTEMAWPIGYADRVHAVKAKLARNGIDINFPLKFVQIPQEGENKIIAQADRRSGVCLLTQAVFEDDDNRMLTKALVEEWTHLTHGVADGTIQQQHLYLDTIIRLMR